MDNMIIFLVLAVVAFVALSIAFVVLFLRLSGIADALNELGSLVGEMWDDLEDKDGKDKKM